MKKEKTVLITLLDTFTKEQVLMYAQLPYTQICLLYKWEQPSLLLRVPSNVRIIEYWHQTSLNKIITELHKEYKDYMCLPYFVWEANSKYAIKIYNKTFWTKINPQIFREKDEMMKFVWEVSEKRFLKIWYSQIVKMNYEEIESQISKTFIVKPTNASASRSTFKVRSADDFALVKSKLWKNYDYIVEEYIDWELYSIDIYMDWENMFLLSYTRSIAMIELSDKWKFSNGFLKKYGEEMDKYFNFILPIVYHIDFSLISWIELWFLEWLRSKLMSINYRGVIHLEYKYDKKTKKIGFLEWWARYGGRRRIFIKNIYNTDNLRIPYYLLFENDKSRFKLVKGKIFAFKEKEYNLNFVRVKTNFTEATNYVSILEKTGDIFKNSFENFLINYYKENFGIKVQKVDFFVEYHKWAVFFPFYKDPLTKLDYILKLDDENFSLFKRKKFKIIEQTFFHDYSIIN